MSTPNVPEAPRNELTLSELRSELNTYSDRISSQLRTINLGVLGVAWLLLLKKSDVATLVASIPEKSVFGIALFCIVALLVDLSQYWLAERVTDEAYDRAEESETKTTTYDADAFIYRASRWCYYLKRWLTVGAALWLVFEIGRALV